MAELPRLRLRADQSLAAAITIAAAAHVAAKAAPATPAAGEPVSPPRERPRPTLPPSVAGDVERLRRAELKRKRKAARHG